MVAQRLALLSAELSRVDPAPARGDATTPAPPDLVPHPGRHAARRTRPGLGELVPEPLRGRVSLGPAQLAVLAVVVAVGLAITCWWVVRADPEPATPASEPLGVGLLEEASEATASPLVQPVADPSAVSGSGSPEPTASVTVDVAGKVRRPGIAVLAPGARVVDALEAAGGARAGVDLTSLNLAQVLTDGEQVLVGVDPPPGVAAAAVSAPDGGAATPAGGLVSLNSATLTELETLPQVGPVTAQAILDWRAEHGGFTSVDELLEVDGIGEVTLSRIAPHVTL